MRPLVDAPGDGVEVERIPARVDQFGPSFRRHHVEAGERPMERRIASRQDVRVQRHGQVDHDPVRDECRGTANGLRGQAGKGSEHGHGPARSGPAGPRASLGRSPFSAIWPPSTTIVAPVT